jgi:endonuclease/exonuclease/phosphatase family metal-dependent hydrolase
MKIVSYNIQYCKGKDDRYDIDRIIREIEGADIIALQEVDRFWKRSGYTDQVAKIAEGLKDYYWVFGAGIDMHAGLRANSDKARVGNPQHRHQFGNMLLSRTPIIYSRHHLLPKYGSTGPLSLQRSAIEGVVLCGKTPLRIYSVHLTHLCSATRLPQIQRLLEIHHSARREGTPINGDLSGMDWMSESPDQNVPANAIFMGDFNFTPDAPEYKKMVGPTSDYGGRISNPEDFVDAWVFCGNDEMSGATSDVQGDPARLDYFFVSTALRYKITSCRIDDQATGSDHQPIWLEIQF